MSDRLILKDQYGSYICREHTLLSNTYSSNSKLFAKLDSGESNPETSKLAIYNIKNYALELAAITNSNDVADYRYLRIINDYAFAYRQDASLNWHFEKYDHDLTLINSTAIGSSLSNPFYYQYPIGTYDSDGNVTVIGDYPWFRIIDPSISSNPGSLKITDGITETTKTDYHRYYAVTKDQYLTDDYYYIIARSKNYPTDDDTYYLITYQLNGTNDITLIEELELTGLTFLFNRDNDFNKIFGLVVQNQKIMIVVYEGAPNQNYKLYCYSSQNGTNITLTNISFDEFNQLKFRYFSVIGDDKYVYSSLWKEEGADNYSQGIIQSIYREQ